MQPRIIKDQASNQIKLEDTLLDYMEIISSLNSKINKHIESTRYELSNVGPGGGGAPKPAGNSYESNSRVLHLET